VCFKLMDCTWREGMGNDLALASVLCPVADIEHTRHAGDEGFIEMATVGVSPETCMARLMENDYSLLQKPIAMRINYLQGLRLGDRDMIEANSNDGTVFTVRPIHPSKFLSLSGS
jgi:hypothetical protein